KEGAEFNENQKWGTAEKKFRRYSMGAKEKYIRLCLELLTAVVGISPLALLYTAAQGGFLDVLNGFRQADGITLQIWQYGLLAMSTICIFAAMRSIRFIKETYLRWRVAHSFRISELDAHQSQSIGPLNLRLNKIVWIVAIVMIVNSSGGLNLDSALQFQRNCSPYNVGTLVRKLNTCPFGLFPEGMMEYLANSQVTNNTGMSEYGGMVFPDQQPVPTINEIMNGTVDATYSNVDYYVNFKPGIGEYGFLNIYVVAANDTHGNSQYYPVAAWGIADVMGIATFSYGKGIGKVVFPAMTFINDEPVFTSSDHTIDKLNRTVCDVKYIQQQGDVHVDFSHKNVTVPKATIVKPNKGQLEIAEYTIQSLQHLTMVTSQLYRSPFFTYLGNNINGEFSTEFLAMQIKSLLRKGHYIINSGFGSPQPIKGAIYTNVNQFNDINLIRLVLIIQLLIHVISIVIALLSFCAPIIAAEVYSASTWWSFGAHAANKPVDGCTGIMSKEQRNRIFALRETKEGHLQMTFPTYGNVPSEKRKYAG
ncbi:22873_t:CDS:2, partial [Gigaspora rosea]